MLQKIIKKRKNGIYQYPSTILSEKSDDVEFPVLPGSETWSAIEKMKTWEMEHPRSQGLSAVQVGTLKRAAVVRINNKLVIMINPRMLMSFGSQVSNEGCHSLNEDRYTVKRSLRGLMSYYDLDGNKRSMYLNKKYVRLIQHEMDHMDGILLRDKGVPYEDTNISNTAKT